MSSATRVDKTVMVLGNAREAGWIVEELLALDYQVGWVSSGGIAAGEGLANPRLSLCENCDLQVLEGHVGGFAARFSRDGAPVAVEASAIVVATGNEHYFPVERYSFPLSSVVLTVPQVQRQLQAPRATSAALSHQDQRVAVLLDWGEETAKETATAALGVALAIREQWHAQVCVLYRNLKVDTYNLELWTRQMRDQGIVFGRYEALDIATRDDGVVLSYVEGPLGADLLVLPEATRPTADTPHLATLLNVHVGEDGYFQDVNIRQYRAGLSSRRGIFFSGGCHMDGTEEELRADAILAAANVDGLLCSGMLEPEEIIAHVDSSICIRCLTCIRSCPHAAVELADYGDVVAACVVDLACRGCGACVANCPVRAIELVGQPMPAWLEG